MSSCLLFVVDVDSVMLAIPAITFPSLGRYNVSLRIIYIEVLWAFNNIAIQQNCRLNFFIKNFVRSNEIGKHCFRSKWKLFYESVHNDLHNDRVFGSGVFKHPAKLFHIQLC